MAQPDLETVQRIFSGWRTGDLSVEAGAFDPQLVFVVRDDFPEPGVVLGIVAVREYMRRFLAQFEHTTFEAEDLRAVGDTVLVRLVQRGTGTASGIQSELHFFMLFTFRGGKIIRMESVRHERDALEAVGIASLDELRYR